MAAAPAAVVPAASAATVVHVPSARLPRPKRRPRTWGELRRSVTFFAAGDTCVCLARDFVAAMQGDPRHAKQDVMRWRKVTPPLARVRDPKHVWQPIRCTGQSGSPPWMMSESAAEVVFAWMSGT